MAAVAAAMDLAVAAAMDLAVAAAMAAADRVAETATAVMVRETEPEVGAGPKTGRDTAPETAVIPGRQSFNLNSYERVLISERIQYP